MMENEREKAVQGVCNFVLDFSGARTLPERNGLERIDVSQVPGTHLFCSDEAKAALQDILKTRGIKGIHFLDAGDFHYVSRLTTDLVEEPFRLVLIDHHTDMQESAVPCGLSCGNWALTALRENPNLKSCILIGPPAEAAKTIPEDVRGKVTLLSQEVLDEKSAERAACRIPVGLPFYLSIDKDALDPAYCVTDWDQGELTVNQICTFIRFLQRHGRILGIDICGRLPEETGDVQKLLEARERNDRSSRMLYDFIERGFAA
ncbi:MAG: arginase family protein [Lachnospiraceae bacterium]|jgi:arginase family enzyme|nr:arginase family protein [Lachnospiraceae bacterium]